MAGRGGSAIVGLVVHKSMEHREHLKNEHEVFDPQGNKDRRKLIAQQLAKQRLQERKKRRKKKKKKDEEPKKSAEEKSREYVLFLAAKAKREMEKTSTSNMMCEDNSTKTCAHETFGITLTVPAIGTDGTQQDAAAGQVKDSRVEEVAKVEEGFDMLVVFDKKHDDRRCCNLS